MVFPKRNLFVCIGNVDRSKAGELVYSQLLREGGFSVGPFESRGVFDFYVGSAGILVSAQNEFNGSVQLTVEMARRADRIFSVEDLVTRRLIESFGAKLGQIVQLDIEDGRSLIVPEQASDLFMEYVQKLEKYAHQN